MKTRMTFLNNKTGLLLCFSLMLVLTACDPSQMMKIENKTASRASVTFIFEEGRNHEAFTYAYDEPIDSDTLIVELDSTNSFKEFHFGMGTWKIQGSMDSLVAMVKSIETKTATSSQKFEGEEQVRPFFKSRISGGYNNVIEIILEK